ncbi:hypothetical protein BC937DRAFT_93644, partial [Endogone sp. FLAS-F59071]
MKVARLSNHSPRTSHTPAARTLRKKPLSREKVRQLARTRRLADSLVLVLADSLVLAPTRSSSLRPPLSEYTHMLPLKPLHTSAAAYAPLSTHSNPPPPPPPRWNTPGAPDFSKIASIASIASSILISAFHSQNSTCTMSPSSSAYPTCSRSALTLAEVRIPPGRVSPTRFIESEFKLSLTMLMRSASRIAARHKQRTARTTQSTRHISQKAGCLGARLYISFPPFCYFRVYEMVATGISFKTTIPLIFFPFRLSSSLQDNSDSQYRTVRGNLPILVFLMLFYLILSHAFRYVFARRTPLKLSTDILHRAYFFLGASLVFISVTNGFSLLIIFTICTINYAIAKTARGSRWNPVLTWAFNIGLLFLNERYEGYKFGVLDPTLAWMDDYRGLNPRWHILFNFTMLRLVSFNMDYYWQCRSPRSVSADVSEQSLLPFSSSD